MAYAGGVARIAGMAFDRFLLQHHRAQPQFRAAIGGHQPGEPGSYCDHVRLHELSVKRRERNPGFDAGQSRSCALRVQ
jgi:hypothetical protein